MNPAGLLLGLLAYNYRRHVLGRDTICSTVRRLFSWRVVLIGWAVLTVWILPHIRRGYPRRPTIPKET